MTWNYRVKKDSDEGFSIVEAYYDSNGSVAGFTGAVEPYGETKEELKKCLELMLEALNKEVI